MEQIYIIATNEDGPCKIGKSRPDVKRLSALQTGNPEPLKEYGTYQLRSGSYFAEKLVHRVLQNYKRNSVSGQKEWFDITVRQADYVTKDVVRTVASVDKSDIIVSTVMLSHYGDSNREAQEYWDWHDENAGGDCPEFDLPGPYLVKALTEEPKQKNLFTFRELLTATPGGYPFLEDHEGDEARPRPNFKDLKSLLPTMRYLSAKGAGQEFWYWSAWLSYCYGRDTDQFENDVLVSCWNQFAPKWNLANENGFGLPEQGIDDTVNGVLFQGIAASPKLGRGSYLSFTNQDFRVILRLPKGCRPLDAGYDHCPDAKAIGSSGIKGFIWPNISEIWNNPFDQQVAKVRGNMNREFADFVARDTYDFPVLHETSKHMRQEDQANISAQIFQIF